MTSPIALDARYLCPACLLRGINSLKVTVEARAGHWPGTGPYFEPELDGAWLALSFDGIYPADHVMVTLTPTDCVACGFLSPDMPDEDHLEAALLAAAEKLGQCTMTPGCALVAGHDNACRTTEELAQARAAQDTDDNGPDHFLMMSMTDDEKAAYLAGFEPAQPLQEENQ